MMMVRHSYYNGDRSGNSTQTTVTVAIMMVTILILAAIIVLAIVTIAILTIGMICTNDENGNDMH